MTLFLSSTVSLPQGIVIDPAFSLYARTRTHTHTKHHETFIFYLLERVNLFGGLIYNVMSLIRNKQAIC